MSRINSYTVLRAVATRHGYSAIHTEDAKGNSVIEFTLNKKTQDSCPRFLISGAPDSYNSRMWGDIIWYRKNRRLQHICFNCVAKIKNKTFSHDLPTLKNAFINIDALSISGVACVDDTPYPCSHCAPEEAETLHTDYIEIGNCNLVKPKQAKNND